MDNGICKENVCTCENGTGDKWNDCHYDYKKYKECDAAIRVESNSHIDFKNI